MSPKPIGERVASVEAELPYVKHELKEYRIDMSEVKSDVSSLKIDVATLRVDVDTLKTDVSVLKEDVSELKQDMTALKDDVSTIKACSKNNSELLGKISKHLNGNTAHTTPPTNPRSPMYERPKLDVSWGKWSGRIPLPGVKELVVFFALGTLLAIGAFEAYILWEQLHGRAIFPTLNQPTNPTN